MFPIVFQFILLPLCCSTAAEHILLVSLCHWSYCPTRQIGQLSDTIKHVAEGDLVFHNLSETAEQNDSKVRASLWPWAANRGCSLFGVPTLPPGGASRNSTKEWVGQSKVFQWQKKEPGVDTELHRSSFMISFIFTVFSFNYDDAHYASVWGKFWIRNLKPQYRSLMCTIIKIRQDVQFLSSYNLNSFHHTHILKWVPSLNSIF